MEKSDKKRILTKILIVIAALTLLSCCFLGSTFAKYVTSANGSGTVAIANWDVSITNTGNGTYTFDQLSPDKDGTDTGTHSTGWVQVATITNSGEVDATVTVTGSGVVTTAMVTLNDKCNETVKATDQYRDYYSDTSLGNTFKIEFASDAEGTPLTDTTFTLEAETGSESIYARVTWTTTSDVMDTWYGTYLESITVTIGYTAVQAEEFPATV